MFTALLIQQAKSSQQQKPITNITLWVIQGLLALTFLFAGSAKLLMPIEMMTAQMPIPLPGMFLRFLGAAEIAGALGLILPGLFHIRAGLTKLASICLLIIMIGATVITLMAGDVVGALPTLVIGLLCIAVAYGRRSWSLA
jgi:uncharacterized membrane protein YphA (DoxX/SURF4 family)